MVDFLLDYRYCLTYQLLHLCMKCSVEECWTADMIAMNNLDTDASTSTTFVKF